MIGLKRDVIYDLDGSLSTYHNGIAFPSGTIVSNFNHIAKYHQDNCPPAAIPLNWDNAIMCNQNIKLRRIFFHNLLPFNTFDNTAMGIIPINNEL